MSYAVFRSYIVLRFVPCRKAFYDSSYSLIVSVGKKYRLGIRIAYIEVVYPVLFFFDPCEFVLLDDIILIFIYRHASYYTSLDTSIHYLPVNIKRRFFFLTKDSFPQIFFYIISCFFIYTSVIRIFLLRQIYFRSAYMKKTVRISFCHVRGFLSVHNIIGQRNNFIRIFFFRPYSRKRSYCCHLIDLL